MCELTNHRREGVNDWGVLKETGVKTVFQTEGEYSAAALGSMLCFVRT